jgi:LCP family protein required for cell wall assembly
MDRSRFKRPGQQKQRQTQNIAFGISQPVSEATSARPAAVPRPGGLAVQHTLTEGIIAPPRRPAEPRQTAVPARPRPARPSQPAQPSTAVLARRIPLDMELPGEESPPRAGLSWVKATHWFRRGLAAAVVVVVLFGGFMFSQSYLKIHKVFRGGTETAAALKSNVRPDLLKGEGSGRVNVLLLGRGGGTHSAPDLTDSIMIASIDPVNNDATLLSVPRDLWVNVPDHGVMKLNSAWETGEFGYLGKGQAGSTDPKAIQAGYDSIDATLKEVLGIDINYHMLVNFQAFKQAVDSVGGVQVNVPADLVDPTMAWENHNDPVLAHAGLQSFAGDQALNYVRSRETSSDFARAERQRSVLSALKGKIVNLGTLGNPLKISQLLSAFGSNVNTDLSLGNASRLYTIIKRIGDGNMNSISLAGNADPKANLVNTGNINGQSVVLPKAGLYKYEDIQNYVHSQLKDPYIMKEHAKILVLNGTEVPGTATATANQLESYGYNVTGTGNAPTSGWDHTLLVDLTHHSKYTKNYLEQRFGQTAATSLADKSIPTNGADFVIIIGSNGTGSQTDQAN